MAALGGAARVSTLPRLCHSANKGQEPWPWPFDGIRQLSPRPRANGSLQVPRCSAETSTLLREDLPTKEGRAHGGVPVLMACKERSGRWRASRASRCESAERRQRGTWFECAA
jgi:hypothetical protein